MQGGCQVVIGGRLINIGDVDVPFFSAKKDFAAFDRLLREHGTVEQQAVLSAWPVDRPKDWLRRVNAVMTAKEQSRT
jgi:hypothetical protein